jgi:hypothetical protein
MPCRAGSSSTSIRRCATSRPRCAGRSRAPSRRSAAGIPAMRPTASPTATCSTRERGSRQSRGRRPRWKTSDGRRSPRSSNTSTRTSPRPTSTASRCSTWTRASTVRTCVPTRSRRWRNSRRAIGSGSSATETATSDTPGYTGSSPKSCCRRRLGWPSPMPRSTASRRYASTSRLLNSS